MHDLEDRTEKPEEDIPEQSHIPRFVPKQEEFYVRPPMPGTQDSDPFNDKTLFIASDHVDEDMIQALSGKYNILVCPVESLKKNLKDVELKGMYPDRIIVDQGMKLPTYFLEMNRMGPITTFIAVDDKVLPYLKNIASKDSVYTPGQVDDLVERMTGKRYKKDIPAPKYRPVHVNDGNVAKTVVPECTLIGRRNSEAVFYFTRNNPEKLGTKEILPLVQSYIMHCHGRKPKRNLAHMLDYLHRGRNLMEKEPGMLSMGYEPPRKMFTPAPEA